MNPRPTRPDAPTLRVYGPDPCAFLGSAHITAGELIPDRLLSPAEVQSLLSPSRHPAPEPLEAAA